MVDKQITIYCLKSPINKVYVGQTVNLWRRLSVHKNRATDKTYSRAPLYIDIVKFGFEAFQVIILDVTYSKKDADEMERIWIEMLDAQWSENGSSGYNLYSGGRSRFSMNEFTKNKISETLTGKRFLSDSHYLNLSKKFSGTGNPYFGKHHSKKVRNTISLSKKGKPLTGEHKLNIAAGHNTPTFKVFNNDKKLLGSWNSYSQCSRDLGLNISHVRLCVLGRSKKHKMLTFKKVANG